MAEPWRDAGYDNPEDWAEAGWPAPPDPRTGKPWEGWQMWRMMGGFHPDGRKMHDDDWKSPYTQHIFTFLKARRLYDNPLWDWYTQMQARYPDYPVPGVNVQDLLRQAFPDWYGEKAADTGLPPLPTLPESLRKQMEALGITPPTAPTWPTERPPAPPAEAPPVAGPAVSPELQAWMGWARRGRAPGLPTVRTPEEEKEAQRAAMAQWVNLLPHDVRKDLEAQRAAAELPQEARAEVAMPTPELAPTARPPVMGLVPQPTEEQLQPGRIFTRALWTVATAPIKALFALWPQPSHLTEYAMGKKTEYPTGEPPEPLLKFDPRQQKGEREARRATLEAEYALGNWLESLEPETREKVHDAIARIMYSSAPSKQRAGERLIDPAEYAKWARHLTPEEEEQWERVVGPGLDRLNMGDLVEIKPGAPLAEGYTVAEMWDADVVTKILREEEDPWREFGGRSLFDPLLLLQIPEVRAGLKAVPTWARSLVAGLGKKRFPDTPAGHARAVFQYYDDIGKTPPLEVEAFLATERGKPKAGWYADAIKNFIDQRLKPLGMWVREQKAQKGAPTIIQALPDTGGDFTDYMRVVAKADEVVKQSYSLTYPRAGTQDPNFLQTIGRVMAGGLNPVQIREMQALKYEAQMYRQMGNLDEAVAKMEALEKIAKEGLPLKGRTKLLINLLRTKKGSMALRRDTPRTLADKMADNFIRTLTWMFEDKASGIDRAVDALTLKKDIKLLIKEFPFLDSVSGKDAYQIAKHIQDDALGNLVYATGIPSQNLKGGWVALHEAARRIASAHFYPSPRPDVWQRMLRAFYGGIGKEFGPTGVTLPWPGAARVFLSRPAYAIQNFFSNWTNIFGRRGAVRPRTDKDSFNWITQFTGDQAILPPGFARSITAAGEVAIREEPTLIGRKFTYRPPKAAARQPPSPEALAKLGEATRKGIGLRRIGRAALQYAPLGEGWINLSKWAERNASMADYRSMVETIKGQVGRPGQGWFPIISEEVEADPAVRAAIEEIIASESNWPDVMKKVAQLYGYEPTEGTPRYVSTERIRVLGDEVQDVADDLLEALSMSPSKPAFRKRYNLIKGGIRKHVAEWDDLEPGVEASLLEVDLPKAPLEGVPPEEIARLSAYTGVTERNQAHMLKARRILTDLAGRSGLPLDQAHDIASLAIDKAWSAYSAYGPEASRLRAHFWAQVRAGERPSAQWPIIEEQIGKMATQSHEAFDKVIHNAAVRLGGDPETVKAELNLAEWGGTPKDLVERKIRDLQDDVINTAYAMQAMELPLAPEGVETPDLETIRGIQEWAREKPLAANTWLDYMREALEEKEQAEVVEKIVTTPAEEIKQLRRASWTEGTGRRIELMEQKIARLQQEITEAPVEAKDLEHLTERQEELFSMTVELEELRNRLKGLPTQKEVFRFWDYKEGAFRKVKDPYGRMTDFEYSGRVQEIANQIYGFEQSEVGAEKYGALIRERMEVSDSIANLENLIWEEPAVILPETVKGLVQFIEESEPQLEQMMLYDREPHLFSSALQAYEEAVERLSKIRAGEDMPESVAAQVAGKKAEIGRLEVEREAIRLETLQKSLIPMSAEEKIILAQDLQAFNCQWVAKGIVKRNRLGQAKVFELMEELREKGLLKRKTRGPRKKPPKGEDKITYEHYYYTLTEEGADAIKGISVVSADDVPIPVPAPPGSEVHEIPDLVGQARAELAAHASPWTEEILARLTPEEILEAARRGLHARSNPPYAYLDRFNTREGLVEAAKQHFGVTDDLARGGMIMPDGTMLDFGAEEDTLQAVQAGSEARDMPHSEVVGLVNHGEWEDLGAVYGLDYFINRTGALRVNPILPGDTGGYYGVMLLENQPISEGQKRVLRKVLGKRLETMYFTLYDLDGMRVGEIRSRPMPLVSHLEGLLKEVEAKFTSAYPQKLKYVQDSIRRLRNELMKEIPDLTAEVVADQLKNLRAESERLRGRIGEAEGFALRAEEVAPAREAPELPTPPEAPPIEPPEAVPPVTLPEHIDPALLNLLSTSPDASLKRLIEETKRVDAPYKMISGRVLRERIWGPFQGFNPKGERVIFDNEAVRKAIDFAHKEAASLDPDRQALAILDANVEALKALGFKDIQDFYLTARLVGRPEEAAALGEVPDVEAGPITPEEIEWLKGQISIEDARNWLTQIGYTKQMVWKWDEDRVWEMSAWAQRREPTKPPGGVPMGVPGVEAGPPVTKAEQATLFGAPEDVGIPRPEGPQLWAEPQLPGFRAGELFGGGEVPMEVPPEALERLPDLEMEIEGLTPEEAEKMAMEKGAYKLPGVEPAAFSKENPPEKGAVVRVTPEHLQGRQERRARLGWPEAPETENLLRESTGEVRMLFGDGMAKVRFEGKDVDLPVEGLMPAEAAPIPEEMIITEEAAQALRQRLLNMEQVFKGHPDVEGLRLQLGDFGRFMGSPVTDPTWNLWKRLGQAVTELESKPVMARRLEAAGLAPEVVAPEVAERPETADQILGEINATHARIQAWRGTGNEAEIAAATADLARLGEEFKAAGGMEAVTGAVIHKIGQEVVVTNAKLIPAHVNLSEGEKVTIKQVRPAGAEMAGYVYVDKPGVAGFFDPKAFSPVTEPIEPRVAEAVDPRERLAKIYYEGRLQEPEVQEEIWGLIKQLYDSGEREVAVQQAHQLNLLPAKQGALELEQALRQKFPEAVAPELPAPAEILREKGVLPGYEPPERLPEVAERLPEVAAPPVVDMDEIAAMKERALEWLHQGREDGNIRFMESADNLYIQALEDEYGLPPSPEEPPKFQIPEELPKTHKSKFEALLRSKHELAARRPRLEALVELERKLSEEAGLTPVGKGAEPVWEDLLEHVPEEYREDIQPYAWLPDELQPVAYARTLLFNEDWRVEDAEKAIEDVIERLPKKWRDLARGTMPKEAEAAVEAAPEPEGIPTMMTHAMRQALLELGYSHAAIMQVTPEQAHAFIKNAVPPTEAPGGPLGDSEPVMPPSPKEAAELKRDMLLERMDQWYKDASKTFDDDAIKPDKTGFGSMNEHLEEIYKPLWGQLKTYMDKMGEAATDWSLYSYRKTNFDTLLYRAFFWPYWQTRTGHRWLKHFMANPYLLAMWTREHETHRKINKDLPENFRDTVRIPDMVPVVGGKYFNPYFFFDPIYSWAWSLEHFVPTWKREGLPTAMVTAMPISPLLGVREWVQPMETEEGRRIEPLTPWTRSLYEASGINLEAGALKAAETAYSEVKPSVYAGLERGRPGMGKRLLGGPEVVPWVAEGRYQPTYLNRVLIDMWLAKEITDEELEEAQASREGAVWDRAQAEVRSERGLTEFSSILMGLRARKMYPSEVEIEEFKRMRGILRTMEEGPDKRAYRDEVYELYPWARQWDVRYDSAESAQKEVDTAEAWRDIENLAVKQEAELVEAIRSQPGNLAYVREVKDAHRKEMDALKAHWHRQGISFFFNPRTRTDQEVEDYIQGQILGMVYPHLPEADNYRDEEGAIDWEAYREEYEAFWENLPENIVKWSAVEQIAELSRDALGPPDKPAWGAPRGKRYNVLALAQEIDEEAYDEWRKANDIPEEALNYTWKKYVIDAANEYYQMVKKDLEYEERNMPEFFKQFGQKDAETLIPYILAEYPGRWTEEELTEELAGLRLPGIWERWNQDNEERSIAISLLWAFHSGQTKLGKRRFKELVNSSIFNQYFIDKESRNYERITNDELKSWLAGPDGAWTIPDPWEDRDSALRVLYYWSVDPEGDPLLYEPIEEEEPEAKGRPPGKAAPMPFEPPPPGAGPPEEAAPPELPRTPPQLAGTTESDEYRRALGEMEAWVAGGKEGDWTPAMEKWFGKDTPASFFWEFYWGELPPGPFAEEARKDPIIEMLLNKAFRTVYDVKEGVYEEALVTLQAWREAHPEVPGDPEEWAIVRQITKKYWELKNAGATNEATALWRYFAALLEKYYPSDRRPTKKRYRKRRGGGGRQRERKWSKWRGWRRWPRIRFYPKR